MVAAAASQIAAYLRDRIGEGLRTVVILTETGWEGVYLREDLREEYDEETYDRTVELFRETKDIELASDSVEHVGQRHAIVHCHEQTFVFQFPFSETESILISVEADIGRELLKFIETCRQMIHGQEG